MERCPVRLGIASQSVDDLVDWMERCRRKQPKTMGRGRVYHGVVVAVFVMLFYLILFFKGRAFGGKGGWGMGGKYLPS